MRQKENEVLHKKTLEYRSEMHTKQRDFEQNLKDSIAYNKPFNAKINEASLKKSRAKQRRLTIDARATELEV